MAFPPATPAAQTTTAIPTASTANPIPTAPTLPSVPIAATAGWLVARQVVLLDPHLSAEEAEETRGVALEGGATLSRGHHLVRMGRGICQCDASGSNQCSLAVKFISEDVM